MYKKDATIYKFFFLGTKVSIFGGLIVLLSVVFRLLAVAFSRIPTGFDEGNLIPSLINGYNSISNLSLVCGIVIIGLGFLLNISIRDTTRIRRMVTKRLFCSRYGNPLHLKDGERLPRIKCKRLGNGQFELTIPAVSTSVDELQNISSSLSSCFCGKFKRYAVVRTETDLSYNSVTFYLEDVKIDKSLIVHDPKELQSDSPTRIPIQQGTYIDLTTNNAFLYTGKTRSGKTYGVISILISAILWGRDDYGSEIIIIDPKKAELSRLPHVYTLGENGDAREILDAMRHFADTIVKRQEILDDLSEESGDAVKWWDVGMHVSFLFLDEYVTLRGLFPKRSTKENEGYTLADFEAVLQRIVTTGASAGCYTIISIAEASVESAGFPSMIRSAMSTRILFRPTLAEGRLIWDSEKLKNFSAERNYKPGDAWFSSTDGEHDNVVFVHFPVMKFKVYKKLGELLNAYYGKN